MCIRDRLNIDINDVWIYGTNIYKLYEDIVREYGNDWAKDRIDVDLPFVISKKEHMETVYYRNDFTNIILVFDYERHDPAFSEEKILEMQHCFEDSTDMGKLYLNYPMIESYLHLSLIHIFCTAGKLFFDFLMYICSIEKFYFYIGSLIGSA